MRIYFFKIDSSLQETAKAFSEAKKNYDVVVASLPMAHDGDWHVLRQLNEIVKPVPVILANGVDETEIQNFLNMQTAAVAKADLRESEFNVRRLVEATIEQFCDSAQTKGIVLADIISPMVPSVLIGDSERLKLILNNLVGNAVKFTDQGYIGIRVSVEGVKNSKKVIRFEVEDTGRGIPPEGMQMLWSNIQQPKSYDLLKSPDGAGLGLILAKNNVELMNGHIGAVSKPDKGSTFWFTAELGWQEQKLTPRPTLDQLRVLVVSSKAAFSKIVNEQLVLRKLGSVLNAIPENALELLLKESADKRAIDLLLLASQDAHEPKLMDFIDSMRKHAEYKKLPILLVANKAAMLLEGPLKNELSGVLQLPLRQSELYRSIAEIIDSKALTKAPPQAAESTMQIGKSVDGKKSSRSSKPKSLRALEQPILDVEMLGELRGLEDTRHEAYVLDQLIDDFIEDGSELITIMEQASLNQARSQLEQGASKLLALSKKVGALKVVRLCRSLEHHGDKFMADEGLVIISALRHEFLSAKNSLLKDWHSSSAA